MVTTWWRHERLYRVLTHIFPSHKFNWTCKLVLRRRFILLYNLHISAVQISLSWPWWMDYGTTNSIVSVGFGFLKIYQLCGSVDLHSKLVQGMRGMRIARKWLSSESATAAWAQAINAGDLTPRIQEIILRMVGRPHFPFKNRRMHSSSSVSLCSIWCPGDWLYSLTYLA